VRILHTGDIHLGELPGPVVGGRNARMDDTLRCMAFVAHIAREEKPDAILVAGDLFHKSKMWADPMLEQIRLAADWLRELGEVAPTLLLLGTENHDNPAAFATISRMSIPGVWVVTSPGLFAIDTAAGPLQVGCVPGLDKGHFRARYPGMDPEQENVQCSKLLGDIVLGLGAQLDPGTPSVLVAHYAVAGVEYDNGQTHVFHQSEVTLPAEALMAAPFDLACLGHIHRMQRVLGVGSKPVYYSGSINRITFNEEDFPKGFWIHDLDNPDEPAWFTTPARELQTVHVFTDGVNNWPELFADDPAAAIEKYSAEIAPIRAAIVRLHYGCDEEIRKRMNHKAIEKALYDAGAFWVQEITPVQITAALSKQEMTETAGPAENLSAWLLAEGLDADETRALVDLARPLIETVSARQPTGKLSGVFVPRRLEVRNYRSYLQAEFDFSQVSFATVNGPNGVGKSALFMDAISDCLFEETREGDLTGWISNDQAAKSGSITFEFAMGDSIWRVVRTRAKSGKTTLALQELVDGDWIDRSGTTARETQQKIIDLLGMDGHTFRCCGLIMQDAYGIFLEADREDRMNVLSNILGLGVYEQLEKLAKEKVTETNRQLAIAKTQLAELDEKLKAKPGVEEDLADAKRDLERVAGEIEAKEIELRDAEDLVRCLETKRDRARELQKQRNRLTAEISELNAQADKHETRLANANELLAREPEILERASQYEEVKERVATLKAKQPQLAELDVEVSRALGEMGDADVVIRKAEPRIWSLEETLANREKLEQAAAEYRKLVSELDRVAALGAQYRELNDQVMVIEREMDRKAEYKAALEHDLKTLESKAAMLADSGCLDPDRAACRFLVDAQQAKIRIPELQEKISGLLAKIEPLRQQVQELDEKMKALDYDQRRHYELQQQVQELRPKAEEASELGAWTELLEDLRAQVARAQDAREKASARFKDLHNRAEALRAELAPLRDLEARLPRLKSWAKAKEQLAAAKEAYQAATEAISALGKNIATKQQEYAQLGEELGRLMVEVGDLANWQANVESLRSQIKTLQEHQNRLHARKGGLEAQLQTLNRDADERRRVAREMEPLAQTVTRYQTLARAFGQDGIPFAVVRAVVPELAALANEILGQMTGGKMSLEMRTERIQKSNKKEVNALEIWITDYMRGSLPYKSRSGGQKVKAALSVAFALADLKARRAGIQLGMMFVDEPPFLDGEGTEAYCDALELMASRYSHMRVIAISHDPRMKARFPQTIEVEDLGEEGSRVKLIA